MRIKHTVVKLRNNEKVFDKIRKANVVSIVIVAGYAIIARYGVNKRTLRKILKVKYGIE